MPFKLTLSRLVNWTIYALTAFFLLNGITALLNYGGFSPTSAIMAVISGLILFYVTRQRTVAITPWQVSSLFHWSYLGVALLALAVYKETDDSFDILYEIRAFAYNMMVIFVFYRFTAERFLYKKYISYIIFIAVVLAIGGILTLFATNLGLLTVNFKASGMKVTDVVEKRLAGIYANANLAGYVANCALIFSLSVLLSTAKWRFWSILTAAFAIITAVGTLSKTALFQAFVILLVFLVVYMSMYHKVKIRIRPLVNSLLIVLFFGIVQLVIAFPSIYRQLNSFERSRVDQITAILTKGKIDSETTSNRSAVLVLGFEMVAERPSFGSGYLSFCLLRDSYLRVGEEAGVHNTFVRIWGEAGIFAFIGYLLFWFYLFQRYFRFKDPMLRFLSVMLALCTMIYNTTGHNALENNLQGCLLGISLGLAAATYSSKPSSDAPIA